jgi:hypothetical protein
MRRWLRPTLRVVVVQGVVRYVLSSEQAPYCQWAYWASHGDVQVSHSGDVNRASIDHRCCRRLPRRCGPITGITISNSSQTAVC